MKIDQEKIYTLNLHTLISEGKINIAENIQATWDMKASLPEKYAGKPGGATLSVLTFDLTGNAEEILERAILLTANIIVSSHFKGEYSEEKVIEFRNQVINNILNQK